LTVRHVTRVSGFILLPALSLLATLVLLPLISRRFGPAGWVALALGQSIGALVSVIVGMAWPIIGGNLVARATTTQEKMSIFRASAYSRIIVLGILLLIAVPITILLSDHYPWVTASFMVGVSLNGLTATWYFAGLGQPRQLIMNEGVVRLVGYIVALAGLLLGWNLGWYGAVTIAIGLAMFSVNWWTIMGRSRLWLPGSGDLALRTIRQQISGTVARVLQASFAFGGPTIFSLIAPLQLPLYSALYQVQRAGNNSLNILPSAFVSWVGSASPAERRRRMRNSIAFIVAVCLIIIISWVSLGPLILDFLFANRFNLSVGGNFLLALSIATVLFCKSLELLILVPLGRAQLVFASNSAASLVGVILVIIGAITFGALGGIGALALSYGALAGFYLSVVVRKSPELAAATTT
jgi:O-antigen/teichoic acid export membrane protein